MPERRAHNRRAKPLMADAIGTPEPAERPVLLPDLCPDCDMPTMVQVPGEADARCANPACSATR